MTSQRFRQLVEQYGDEWAAFNACLDDPRVGEYALLCMRSRDYGLRWQVVDAMREIGGHWARVIARIGISDPNPQVRSSAADIFALEGQQQDGFRLIQALNDRSWLVRSSVADALANVRTKAAQRALLSKASTDTHKVVRRDSYHALSNYGHAVIEPIQAQLLVERNSMVLVAMHWALYKLGNREHLTEFLKGIEDEDDCVRHNVVNALDVDCLRPEDIATARKAIRQLIVTEPNPGVASDAEALLCRIDALRQ
jgi:hypothetical protein